jgi:hypothetical protein
MTNEEIKEHIRMQDKIFPDWRKYWTWHPTGSYQLKDKSDGHTGPKPTFGKLTH